MDPDTQFRTVGDEYRRTMTRRFLFSRGSHLLGTAALAAQAEGKIQSIDKEALTITLEDGQSYKLPGEFDVSAISEGMEIFFAYDDVAGQKMITDLELTE